MNNHALTVNGIHYSKIKYAMIALGISETESDRFYHAVIKENSFLHDGVLVYFRNGEAFSKRSRLRQIKDSFPKQKIRRPKVEAPAFPKEKTIRPIMRTLCTAMYGESR